jgi:mRNA interferase RelE/StbE
VFLDRALDEFGRLPKGDYELVRRVILDLAEVPQPLGCLSIVGRGGWHIRVGNYRVIYEIDDEAQTVTILHIGRRRNIHP